MGEIKLDDIKALSVEERLDLIERIWDTFADSPETIPMPDWHRDVLDERLRNLEGEPDAGAPWADVKARMTNRS
jgi:putative addiction module component (TIGR02574 family)